MTVEFILKITAMKEQMMTNIFLSECKAFDKDMKAGKVTVERDDINSRIIITIKDKQLEKDFIDGLKSFREKTSLKMLRAIGISSKVLYDGKEVKI
jgi:hypothetical protein